MECSARWCHVGHTLHLVYSPNFTKNLIQTRNCESCSWMIYVLLPLNTDINSTFYVRRYQVYFFTSQIWGVWNCVSMHTSCWCTHTLIDLRVVVNTDLYLSTVICTYIHVLNSIKRHVLLYSTSGLQVQCHSLISLYKLFLISLHTTCTDLSAFIEVFKDLKSLISSSPNGSTKDPLIDEKNGVIG